MVDLDHIAGILMKEGLPYDAVRRCDQQRALSACLIRLPNHVESRRVTPGIETPTLPARKGQLEWRSSGYGLVEGRRIRSLSFWRGGTRDERLRGEQQTETERAHFQRFHDESFFRDAIAELSATNSTPSVSFRIRLAQYESPLPNVCAKFLRLSQQAVNLCRVAKRA
jgi:hypothetical protein